MKRIHHTSRHPELLQELQIHCEECSGLCCCALYCAKVDGFPENKPEGIPCSYLQQDNRCEIHARLSERNLTGCRSYDCFGAGQKVTKRIYQRLTWRNHPDKNEIFAVFQKVYQLQEMLWYLVEADCISQNRENEIDALIWENLRITSMEPARIRSFDEASYRLRVNSLLKDICRRLHCLDETAKKQLHLIGKDMRQQNLFRKDLSMALLLGAKLQGCCAYGTNFLGADLRGAQLHHANLRDALFLTQRQINSADGNEHTLLPPNLQYPAHWLKQGTS